MTTTPQARTNHDPKSAARRLLDGSHHELSLVNTDEPDEHTIPSILAALTLAVQALAEDKTPPLTRFGRW